MMQRNYFDIFQNYIDKFSKLIILEIFFHTLIVFDINLRQSFFTKEMIINSLKLSSILKLNDEELLLLMKLLD